MAAKLNKKSNPGQSIRLCFRSYKTGFHRMEEFYKKEK